MNWWVAGSIAAAGVVVICAITFVEQLTSHPPYNHVLTSVERIDEDEDALRVFHDKVRGVTCYQTYGVVGALACVPDSWLKDQH